MTGLIRPRQARGRLSKLQPIDAWPMRTPVLTACLLYVSEKICLYPGTYRRYFDAPSPPKTTKQREQRMMRIAPSHDAEICADAAGTRVLMNT